MKIKLVYKVLPCLVCLQQLLFYELLVCPLSADRSVYVYGIHCTSQCCNKVTMGQKKIVRSIAIR